MTILNSIQLLDYMLLKVFSIRYIFRILQNVQTLIYIERKIHVFLTQVSSGFCDSLKPIIQILFTAIQLYHKGKRTHSFFFCKHGVAIDSNI